MASGASADGFFRCFYEGCISGCDTAIERRPYHRNCSCALHESSKNKKKNHCSHGGLPKVSYPIRRAWSEGSLALVAAAAASSSAQSSPSSSSSSVAMVGGGGIGRRNSQSSLCDLEE
ncbi:hypothetical protein CsatB_013983 [Cannabis sativa]|uniref:Uncharacterized protein n=2 Tax=Cannabis sativa TaxID=3483 RepID=A0AB40E4W8_CANSA|nr:uncharacterized protein LOC115695704 [Cannabis sativa]KAF4352243.1 hypothetical protein F8388_003640 [Cannabis sativa]KAF4356115.1 hypothetical protein G4B88_012580 [Cannabis sativa]KAF4365212.1 hypothetical protein G4B88_000371 [Cannabis sativa]